MCLAKGNPTPIYKWLDIDTYKTIQGSVLTIKDYMMSDQNHDFRCTAENIVAGNRRQITATVTFTVTGTNIANNPT